MPYVHIVTALAVLQFVVFGFKVASARGRYGVKAPAITGNEIFERLFRIQMNTLEQLIVLLPGLYLYASYFSPFVAAALGVVYLLGRELYAFTYARDPAKFDRLMQASERARSELGAAEEEWLALEAQREALA